MELSRCNTRCEQALFFSEKLARPKLCLYRLNGRYYGLRMDALANDIIMVWAWILWHTDALAHGHDHGWGMDAAANRCSVARCDFSLGLDALANGRCCLWCWVLCFGLGCSRKRMLSRWTLLCFGFGCSAKRMLRQMDVLIIALCLAALANACSGKWTLLRSGHACFGKRPEWGKRGGLNPVAAHGVIRYCNNLCQPGAIQFVLLDCTFREPLESDHT